MAWTQENHVAGQEAYRMDNVGDYRKVDTRAQHPDDVDGREPELKNVAEWVRPAGGQLEDRYGPRVADKRVDGN